MALIKKTLNQRRAELTEKIKEARQEYHNIQSQVRYEVRKANPGLKERDWSAFYEIADNDPRVKVAEARLLALCDAANIMGAEID